MYMCPRNTASLLSQEAAKPTFDLFLCALPPHHFKDPFSHKSLYFSPFKLWLFHITFLGNPGISPDSCPPVTLLPKVTTLTHSCLKSLAYKTPQFTIAPCHNLPVLGSYTETHLLAPLVPAKWAVPSSPLTNLWSLSLYHQAPLHRRQSHC